MKVEILTDNQAVKAADYPIEIKVYGDGTQIIPSSATITVKDPEGDAYVEDKTMNIESGVGTMTYTLSSDYTGNLEEDAIIEVSYVKDSVTYKAKFLFDIVLNKLKPCIVDEDLKNYSPLLANERWTTQQNFDKQIQEAWKVIYRDIKNKGKRPHMLIDGTQLREIHILKALELIYFDFSKAIEDIWWEKYLVMKERYENQFAALVIKYDEDEDGLIDADEKIGLGQITFER